MNGGYQIIDLSALVDAEEPVDVPGVWKKMINNRAKLIRGYYPFDTFATYVSGSVEDGSITIAVPGSGTFTIGDDDSVEFTEEEGDELE